MTFGRILVGLMGDKIGVTNSFILSSLISGLAQLFLWNFANSFTAITIFAVAQGAFGGCFISLVAPVSAQLYGTDKLATLSGLLILFNGPGTFEFHGSTWPMSYPNYGFIIPNRLGNLAGAPLYGTLLDATNRNWHAGITLSGGCQLLGAATILYGAFFTLIALL